MTGPGKGRYTDYVHPLAEQSLKLTRLHKNFNTNPMSNPGGNSPGIFYGATDIAIQKSNVDAADSVTQNYVKNLIDDLYTSPALATGFAIGAQQMWNVETGAVFTFLANTHIVSAQMSGVDLVGAGATFDNGPTGNLAGIFAATPILDLANTEGVSVQADTTTCVLGTTGVASSVPAAAGNFFVLTTAVAAVTYGRIYVRLTYYIRA